MASLEQETLNLIYIWNCKEHLGIYWGNFSNAPIRKSHFQINCFIFLQKLTGKNHSIWDINYENLTKLDINSKLTYGECKLDNKDNYVLPIKQNNLKNFKSHCKYKFQITLIYVSKIHIIKNNIAKLEDRCVLQN